MKLPGQSSQLKRMAIIFAGLWIAAISGFFAFYLFETSENTYKVALLDASHSFEKDLVYRRWAASHGGVYVPVSETTPPNPYLAHLENRDVTTTSGLKLTLINPAYMTRQVHEFSREQYGHQGHITSLTPLRPENKPDAWETAALESFAQGATEKVEISSIGNLEYLRFMRPMLTEKSCLKCHEEQGYREGEIRGGVSVSIPMEPLQIIMSDHNIMVGFGSLLVLLFGLICLSLVYSRLKRYEDEQLAIAAQLFKSEKFLNETGRMARVGGWELDAETNEVEWTNETYNLHEVPVDQKILLNEGVNFYHPSDQPKMQDVIEKAIKYGEGFDIEARLITAKNNFIWVRVIGEAVIADGRTIKVTGTFQDISEHKHAEEVMQLNERIDSKNKEMNEVISIVSHDLRSPLVTIEGFGDMLGTTQDDLMQALSDHEIPSATRTKLAAFIETNRDSLNYINLSVAKMKLLIDGLLQVSRLGSLDLKIETLDMNHLLSNLCSELALQCSKAGVRVEIAELPSCYGDAVQVTQLFTNLIGNALKYTDPERSGVIKISGHKEGDCRYYCVEDNGLGISLEFQEKIFKLFSQLNPKSDGVGLGLCIVKKIAERHEGQVWIESEPGEGSKFYVSLCLACE